ncbi:MAG: hypothetical protein WBV46_01775 [Terriglobales bacterium]|jgi:hypothetical protein
MRTVGRMGLFAVMAMLMCGLVFGQNNSTGNKQKKTQRQPVADAPAKSERTRPANDNPGFYILDGLPISLALHHDTEVGTNAPIDVYQFVIELQVMNSDGDLEPEGLDIFNFYTAHPQDRKDDVNPKDARDCGIWYKLQTAAIQTRNPKSKTWPYVEFVTSTDARVVQTNEDGAVWYSDDIECWGSSDRFPPF